MQNKMTVSMGRILFFALSLTIIVMVACQANPPKEGQEAAPSAHLTANKETSPQGAKLAEQAEAAPASTPQKEEQAFTSEKGSPKIKKQVVDSPEESKKAAKATKNEPPPSPGPSAKEITTATGSRALLPSHEQWNSLLQKHVSAEGRVDYQGIIAEKAKLQAYLDELAAHPPRDSWPRNERLAYWINAYNAFTVKLIVDNYPLSSITKLHGGKPWSVKWIELGDKTYSLDQIENEIIRPRFNEPRIHFAVNCAAVSCPSLLNEAYMADKLGRQLEQQARRFINNPKFNEISPEKVKVSRIFDWYAKDFGNLIGYLNQYSETKIDQNAQITYMEYDWALNGQ